MLGRLAYRSIRNSTSFRLPSRSSSLLSIPALSLRLCQNARWPPHRMDFDMGSPLSDVPSLDDKSEEVADVVENCMHILS